MVINRLQDAEKVPQRRSRFAQKLNVSKRTPLASSLAAALLGSLFDHPASRSCASTIPSITVAFEHKLSFPTAC